MIETGNSKFFIFLDSNLAIESAATSSFNSHIVEIKQFFSIGLVLAIIII